MSVTFRRGQELGRADGMNLFLKKKDGTPKNAAVISYDLYDFTTGVEVLLPPSPRQPVNPAVGEYFASFIIHPDANIGKYRIRWTFQEFTGSPAARVVQEFAVVADATQVITVPGITPVEYDLVRGLRIALRDNNPARNYHFMPPAGEESVNQFTRVFGFIWEDYELLEFLRMSNDVINMHPPQTFYENLDMLISQHRNWRTLLLTGAMVHSITALVGNQIADEFSYSIGGVSLDIEKSSKYQSMASDAHARFTEWVTAAKETVKVIRGLQQSRYGVGIRSSFGPSVGRGALTPRRFLGI
ncbi:MAG: hypothetical protein BWY99_01764 [Synergistetes bacterium ADurb.BinA166]|nr:MAG: hypothetical protein BWY99_01764 [Synergistetes bacterium ADurb.BinA166]